MKVKQIRRNGMYLIAMIAMQVLLAVLFVCGTPMPMYIMFLPILVVIGEVLIFVLAKIFEIIIGVLYTAIQARRDSQK
jgi:uncharacterized membrane protein